MVALLLWLLPLDLHAPLIAPHAEIAVELTITPEGSYRIGHRIVGARRLRVVTGATDRNCEEAVDRLLVDGRQERLSAPLPCGGLAFRSAQQLGPGGGWSIGGSIALGPGRHRVVARYCPTPVDLERVDPAARAASGPPWFRGCVESAPQLVRTPARTPDEAWTALLSAMRSADEAGIAELTTPAMRESLHARVRDEAPRVAFARWGAGLPSWAVRWRVRAADTAEAALGPEAKEHRIAFVRDAARWRLSRWDPGE